MLIFILLIFLLVLQQAASECIDKSPYCNSNDCTVRPGYSMIYCRKTCGNCTEFCEDSKYITCSAERKKDCDEMLADYCPKLCGRCYSRQLKSRLIDGKSKRTKTIPVSQPNVGTIKTTTSSSTPSTSTRSSSIRLKQPRSSLISGPRMLPNGTFVSPPIPKYEKLDDFQETEYPVASIEELIPEPSRIWPEPEPARIQPYQPYSPDMLGYPTGVVQPPNYQSSPWSPPPSDNILTLSSSSVSGPGVPRRSQPKSRLLTFLPYSERVQLRPKYPDHKQNTIITIPPEKEDYEEDEIGSPSLSMKLVEPFLAPGKRDTDPQALTNLINLLGCKDKDELVCKYVTVETCLSRPGYYLKLCPVTCKNCSGLQCIDSIKINCDDVKSQGACKLSVAQEYCPRTCEYCNPPKGLAENMSECKDELDTCEQLAESGACEQEFGKSALRLYCAKSCGFCKTSQFYFSDAPLMSSVVSARKLLRIHDNHDSKNSSNMTTNKILIH